MKTHNPTLTTCSERPYPMIWVKMDLEPHQPIILQWPQTSRGIFLMSNAAQGSGQRRRVGSFFLNRRKQYHG